MSASFLTNLPGSSSNANAAPNSLNSYPAVPSGMRSFNTNKSRVPFRRPYVAVRDSSSSATRVHVQSTGVHVLVRYLQNKRLRDAERKAMMTPATPRTAAPLSAGKPQPTPPTRAQMLQANVRRQAISVSVQPAQEEARPTPDASAMLLPVDTPHEQPQPAPRRITTSAANRANSPTRSVSSASTSSLSAALLRKNRPMHRPMPQSVIERMAHQHGASSQGMQAAAAATAASASRSAAAAAATTSSIPTSQQQRHQPQSQQQPAEPAPSSSSPFHLQPGRTIRPHSSVIPPQSQHSQIQVSVNVPKKRTRNADATASAALAASNVEQKQDEGEEETDPFVEATSPQRASKRTRPNSPPMSPSLSPVPAASSSVAPGAPLGRRTPPISLSARQHSDLFREPLSRAQIPRTASPTPSQGSHGSVPSRTSSAYRSLAASLSQAPRQTVANAQRFNMFSSFGNTALTARTPTNSAFLPRGVAASRQTTPGAILAANMAATQQADFDALHPNRPRPQNAPQAAAAASSNQLVEHEPPHSGPRYSLGMLRLQRAREEEQRRRRDASMQAAIEKELEAPTQPAESIEQTVATSSSAAAAASSSSSSSSLPIFTPPRPPNLASSSQRQPAQPSKRKISSDSSQHRTITSSASAAASALQASRDTRMRSVEEEDEQEKQQEEIEPHPKRTKRE